MKKICIYGKGGIGKSTTVTNVAAAMADMGLKVAVVGCDPKADTTRCLVGKRIPTVLASALNGTGEDFVYTGYKGIMCIESGGPEPGTGCAGRGIASALSAIREKDLFFDLDVVIYDVLGDVVCGGFSTPLREGIADDVYLVTTADFMALYAANNICRGIAKFAKDGPIRLAGLIYNGRSGRDDMDVAKKLAKAVGTEVVSGIPMSEDISRAELERKTVVEMYPDSDAAQSFRILAEKMIKGSSSRCIPTPLSDDELEELCRFQQ